jgi:CheY-like chemotaxis protein
VPADEEPKDYYDSLRMTDGEQRELLRRLASRRPTPPPEDHRREERLNYTPRGLLVRMRHPGGTTELYLVRPRNLSRSGIAFLHGSFCHTGTTVHVTLRTIDDEPATVSGRVTRCRHVQGNVHEIGVKFDMPIEVYQFVRSDAKTAQDRQASRELPRMRGRVLFVDDCIDDRELFSFYANSLGLLADTAEDGQLAVERARTAMFDLVLTDYNLPDLTGDELFDRLRQADYTGPIVLVTAETDEALLDKLGQKGFDDILLKPYQLEDMVDKLCQFLSRDRSHDANVDPIMSEQWHNLKMRPLILNYLERLEDRIDSLQRELIHHQYESIADGVLEIKGTSGGYGYPQISGAADELLQLATADQVDTDQLRSRFEALADLCAAACRIRHDRADGA